MTAVKGTGEVMFVCMSVCGCIVTNWFSSGKNHLSSYHVETRTAFQPAEQPTHSFIWINLTLQGRLPANSALRVLSVFLSLRSTLCSWPKLKNVFTLHWQNEWRSTQTFCSIKSISLPLFFFWSNLEMSYRGSSQTSGNRTEPLH